MDFVTSPAIWTIWPSYWLGSSRSFLMGVAPLQPVRLARVRAARIHGTKPRTTCRADLIAPPVGWKNRRIMSERSYSGPRHLAPSEHRRVQIAPIRTAAGNGPGRRVSAQDQFRLWAIGSRAAGPS